MQVRRRQEVGVQHPEANSGCSPDGVFLWDAGVRCPLEWELACRLLFPGSDQSVYL